MQHLTFQQRQTARQYYRTAFLLILRSYFRLYDSLHNSASCATLIRRLLGNFFTILFTSAGDENHRTLSSAHITKSTRIISIPNKSITLQLTLNTMYQLLTTMSSI
ncbi:hypothetical protein HMPREF3208_00062 [Gardnerella vaginalis]|uniref:Uncharacterized protein n=1 Tax=Gardnerella vaginalis TaxID=2702 RepID=A0A133P3A9_GARVA|nr:hypothetical protein HMPREF3208_00062 [Gardnerella vaginalis]